MSIRKIKIAGFRSLRDVTWEPGKLNVVIGPNGSGKSNLLRALALLQKSATGSLSDEVLRLGGIAALLWDGQVNELAWTVEDGLHVSKGSPAEEAFRYELRLRQIGQSSAYRVEIEQLDTFSVDAATNYMPYHMLFGVRAGKGSFELAGLPVPIPEGDMPGEDSLLPAVFPVDPLVRGFRDTLAGWSIYHDIHVDQKAPIRQAAIARMDRQVATDGQNLVPVLHTLYTGSRDFKKLVDDAMRAAFSKDYEELVFPPAADQRVQLRVRWRSLKTEQSAADLSDGTLRFLLLLAILALLRQTSFAELRSPLRGAAAPAFVSPGTSPGPHGAARRSALPRQVCRSSAR